MANIESKNLLVAVKSFARAQALPLDRDEVWESLDAAKEYTQSPIAYAGQTIKALASDGKYHIYVLQPSANGLGLEMEEALGSGSPEESQKQYVQVVDGLPEIEQVQDVIYINSIDNAGYIWTGTEYKQIFRNVETDISELQEQKANLSGATFTGEVILAADPTQDMGAVTKQYVDNLISNIVSSTPGIVDSENSLPESYKAGQTWRVAEAGTYANKKCESGDLIIALVSGESILEENFMVVQANIEGAVSGPESSIDASIAIFDGTTGKKIANSDVSIASVKEAILMRHEHKNLELLESYTKTQQELEEFVEQYGSRIKYEITTKPEEALVDYREKEIRVLCPANTKWEKQSVGPTGNSNMYYMAFKAYAPKDAVSFKEGDRGVIIDKMYTFEDDFAGIDKYGRKYSICWLALASYDASSDTWNYFGKNSTTEKYIGWTYCVEWYNADGVVIESDMIRINLSNEDCHSQIEPSYVLAVKKELQEVIKEIEGQMTITKF